jgi:hypothetical protein
MSDKRKSISVRPDSYKRLLAWCRDNGKTMSGAVEECIAGLPRRASAAADAAVPSGSSPRPLEAPAPTTPAPQRVVSSWETTGQGEVRRMGSAPRAEAHERFMRAKAKPPKAAPTPTRARDVGRRVSPPGRHTVAVNRAKTKAAVEQASARVAAANPCRHLSPDEYEAQRKAPTKVQQDPPRDARAVTPTRPESNIRSF